VVVAPDISPKVVYPVGGPILASEEATLPKTIVALNAGDQIFFCVKTTLPSLSLISGSSSLFTIYQIK
jgi:hypothetical protein